MSSWWKVVGINAYVNPAQVNSIYSMPAGGGNYKIDVDMSRGSAYASDTLEGTWATQAEADDAIRRLVQGIDPSTF